MEIFKIRASASGLIATGTMGLTGSQEAMLETLSNKAKLTDIQAKELSKLQYKKIFPELPKTAKSYCEKWLKEKLYNRKIEISTKYTEKGIVVEGQSINFIADKLGYGMLSKNEEYRENDFFTGTPDIVVPKEVIDAKNSWDFPTFPLFEIDIPEDDYYWQAQVYMKLFDKQKFRLVYTLMDTPDFIIESEAKRFCFKNGIDLDECDYQSFYDRMTYGDIQDELKIKVFEVERNDYDIALLEQRVIECRKYIAMLIADLPEKVKQRFI